MRYNRADIISTLRAAKRDAALSMATRYVFATAGGCTIWHSEPPKGQGYYKVYPGGRTILYDMVQGKTFVHSR